MCSTNTGVQQPIHSGRSSFLSKRPWARCVCPMKNMWMIMVTGWILNCSPLVQNYVAVCWSQHSTAVANVKQYERLWEGKNLKMGLAFKILLVWGSPSLQLQLNKLPANLAWLGNHMKMTSLPEVMSLWIVTSISRMMKCPCNWIICFFLDLPVVS
jgi:hypothetical protein